MTINLKWVSLGLYGLVAFQMGADPTGTQNGIKQAFTSANATARQVPILFQGTPPADDPAQQTDQEDNLISLSDGRQVRLPSGYRVVPTGP